MARILCEITINNAMQRGTTVLVSVGLGLVGLAVVGGGIWAIVALTKGDNGPVQRECTLDGDCDEGRYCLGGRCVEYRSCETVADCPTGQVCVGNLCGRCTGPADCPLPNVCIDGVCGVPPPPLFFMLTAVGQDGKEFALTANNVNDYDALPRRMHRSYEPPDPTNPAQQLQWVGPYWPGRKKRRLRPLSDPDLRLDGGFIYYNGFSIGLNPPEAEDRINQFWEYDPVTKHLVGQFYTTTSVGPDAVVCRSTEPLVFRLNLYEVEDVPADMVIVEFTYTEYYSL